MKDYRSVLILLLKMNLHILPLVCCALLFTRGQAQGDPDDECKNAPKEFIRLLLDAINKQRRDVRSGDLKYDCYLGKRVFSGKFEGTSPQKFIGESEYEGSWEDTVRAAVNTANNQGLMLLRNFKFVGCHVKLATSPDTGAHKLSFECAVAEKPVR